MKKHVPNLRTEINQPAVFMQDNSPCHTAKSVKTLLSEEDVTVMEWPAQSPEMNPFDNVWKLLNIKISKHIISQRQINLNSWIASTKSYISKKNKMRWLKFAT